jgi:hypothetical protein
MKIRLLAFDFALLLGLPTFAANPTIEVWKSTTGECCGNLVDHLKANGFGVKVNATDPLFVRSLPSDMLSMRSLCVR